MRQRTLWGIHGYAAWFGADSAIATGMALRSLAVSLMGYHLSGSTIAAGWLATLSMITQQGSGIVGGTFVDRHDRRYMVETNAIIGLLCWGTISLLAATNSLSFALLTAITVIASAVHGFLSSATDAMLRSLIDVRHYPKARSLNEGRDAAVNMAGSPLGGFLYGLRPWLPFLAMTLAYAVAGVAASALPRTAAKGPEDRESPANMMHGFTHDFVEGWRWTLRKRLLMMVLTAASLLNFAVNGMQYGIQLHLMSQHSDATRIGLINAAMALAMLIGSLIAGLIADRVAVGPAVCLAFIMTCVAATPLILTDDYWMILSMNAVMGLSFPSINAMLLGFIFARTPSAMQGRVTVTLSVPAQALSAFCGATAGNLLPAVGFHGTMLVFLSVMAASTLLVACTRSIRAIPRADAWHLVEL